MLSDLRRGWHWVRKSPLRAGCNRQNRGTANSNARTIRYTVPRSGAQSLIELAKSAPADYVLIDLRDGKAWLTSRLYLFAVVLPPVLGVRCFVFIGDLGPIPRHFLGVASPGSIASALERRYPWLRAARAEAQLLHPLIQVQPSGAGEILGRYPAWYPFGDAEAALKRLAPLITTGGPWDLQRGEALSDVIRNLFSPIDLSQPQQVEALVTRFLDNSDLRRPHVEPEPPGKEWVHLGLADEHARWIEDERQLIDLLGKEISRPVVVPDEDIDEETLINSIVRQRGDFVSVTDREGRFNGLIDRAELLERLVVGRLDGHAKMS